MNTLSELTASSVESARPLHIFSTVNQENYEYLKDKLELEQVKGTLSGMPLFLFRDKEGKIESIIDTDLEMHPPSVIEMSMLAVCKIGEIWYCGEKIDTGVKND